jgi:oligoendopeptidase F
MNFRSRYLFEKNFYRERKKGLVSVERLNQIMLESQKKAYGSSLDQYFPTLWTNVLFYTTSEPFYNFPYTFGYLFGMGIYEKSCVTGTSFEAQYISLLKDTGTMSVEELALKHLNEDITKPSFWQKAIEVINKDVETFVKLVKEVRNKKANIS